MSDTTDKTVFQSGSFGGPEMTSIRPNPGGRAGPGQPRRSGPFQPPNGPPKAAASSADVNFFKNIKGLNPIVSAAAPIISVFEKTRGAMSHPDIAGFHKRLIREVREFESRLRDDGFAPEVVLVARYIACSILDEAVLNTPWGSASGWAQNTLLTVFHKETSGGQKFFLILEKMCQSPADNLYMIEFMYVCLSFGFEGKYRIVNQGSDALEKIREELFSIIRRYRGEYDRTLSDRWQGLGSTNRTLTDAIPTWVVGAAVACILALSFTGFRWWLYSSSTPVVKELKSVEKDGQESLFNMPNRERDHF